MMNWFRFNHLAWLRLILSLSALFSFQAYAVQDDLLKQIEVLDERFQKLATQYYQANSRNAAKAASIDLLKEGIELNRSTDPALAIQLLFTNLDRLTDNTDHPVIVEASDLLLEQNHRQLADQIYKLVEDTGSDANLAYFRFNFAKYFARLNEWQKVTDYLEDSFNELAGNDSDYAYLLQGGAFQYLKEHRRSQESYANIPESSNYYIQAQLNSAIANIRQGWITDAREVINNLIPVSKRSKDSELTHRIYLVLGYALLQNEYYRDAREVFRKVSRDSQYVNKALFGIALTAVSQGDYVGSLNAIKFLVQNKVHDLTIDEAYLLLPYIYERLGENDQISIRFSEAIDHYQQRLIDLNNIKQRKTRFEDIQLEDDSGELVLNSIRFPFSESYPSYLLTNRKNLNHMSANNKSTQLTPMIESLLRQHDSVIYNVIEKIIERRKEITSSYLNQARYGLARHYDDQKQSTQQ